MTTLTRDDAQKAVRVMLVGGTLGALFSALSRCVPFHIAQALRAESACDVFELVVRYGYLVLLLTYFFVTHFRINQPVKTNDLRYDVVQSIATLAAAYMLGFVAPADGLPLGFRGAIVSANMAVFVIASLAIRWFPEKGRVMKLRWIGGLCALVAGGVVLLPLPRGWGLAADLALLVILLGVLLSYWGARMPSA